MALKLQRKVGESIVIGGGITVTVTRITGQRVSLAIDAPQSVHVRRSELPELPRPAKDEQAITDSGRALLDWRWEQPGCWSAQSRYSHDGRLMTWRVTRDLHGEYGVSETDLLLPHFVDCPFRTIDAARNWCQAMEDQVCGDLRTLDGANNERIDGGQPDTDQL